jgi:hypothetical protein
MAADYTHFVPDQHEASEVCVDPAYRHNAAFEFSQSLKDRL